MTEEELKALEERLGRKATDEEKEREIERLAAEEAERAEAVRVKAYLDELVAVGKRHGYGIDVALAENGEDLVFSVDRRAEDGSCYGDDSLLAAKLDPRSPYPTLSEREEAERRYREAIS